MPPPTGQRTKRGSLAPTDINEAKPTSPRKEPPFKEPPSASPDGADIEAPANGGDSKQDGKKIDEPIDEAAQEEAGAASGSHRYTKLPTTDDAIEKVEDANEAVKSKFHHVWKDTDLLFQLNDVEGADNKPPTNSKAERTARIVTLLVSLLGYLAGFLALLYYARYVQNACDYLDVIHTVVPVGLHVVGVGFTIFIKLYYDMSPKIGPMEAMHIIVRSRLWLFPGVLGASQLQRRSRKEVDAILLEQERKKNVAPDDPTELKFNMTTFLRRCCFPEFRVLFRAVDLYPWSSISDLTDMDTLDQITEICQAQVMRVFPVLDMLDCGCSIIRLANPLNWTRFIKSIRKSMKGKSSPVDKSTLLVGESVTRYEEIEVDDVSADPTEDWYQRREPMPWGTLRLMNYKEVFRAMHYKVNAMALLVFGLMFMGYMMLIFGEIDFYRKIARAEKAFQELNGLRASPNITGTEALEATRRRLVAAAAHLTNHAAKAQHQSNKHHHNQQGVFGARGDGLDGATEPALFYGIPYDPSVVGTDFTPEDFEHTPMTGVYSTNATGGRGWLEYGDTGWSEEYRGLLDFRFTAAILLLSLIPFAIQVSSLIAENSAVPLLVMDTMRFHVENFTKELDQYLTVLAVHKGTFALPDTAGDFNTKKISMTRDMALSWRMKRFIAEIEHDSKVINSGVGLMILNIVCHVVPLNLFLFQDEAALKHPTCIPLWVFCFALAQLFGIFNIIQKGIECNEKLDGGVDKLLLEWQLKYNMIGWSGGFMNDSVGYESIDVFLPRNPPGETAADIAREEAKGEKGYGVKIQAEQQHRMTSIVKVLAHYEAQVITPFSVLGVTVTKQFLTLIVGFFGAAVAGVVTELMDKAVSGDMMARMMCHRPLFWPGVDNPIEAAVHVPG